MKLRRALSTEAVALAAIEHTQPNAAGWLQDGFETELVQPCASIWVAEQENQLVGFVAVRSAGDMAEILNVAVKAGQERQGIGNALLSYALQQLRQQGVRQVSLEVAENNFSAQRLYTRVGLTVLGRRKDFYHTGIDALILGKIL